ncbi:MAG: hypothetical protein E6R06_33445 [Mycobacterium sp.]|jgi:hypothetical protein|nr:MAG: hypothetical protein E6R06_33445 [Mycobacterium sp.]
MSAAELDGWYISTDAALMRPDGTAAFVRIVPDLDTLNAVVGDVVYGFTPKEIDVTFWGVMPIALILTAGDDEYGTGERNPLAESVFHAVTGADCTFLGTILAVNNSGGADALFVAVEQHAGSVRNLVNRKPRRDDDYAMYGGY